MKQKNLAAAVLMAMLGTTVSAAPGEQAGAPIVVEGVFGASVLDSRVSVTSDGYAIMVWVVEDLFTGQRELKMQRFAPWGDQIGAPMLVAGPGFGLANPRVAMAPDRNALIVWQEDGVDGDGSAIMARAYDAGSGLPRDNAFMVNQTTVGNQQMPSVAMDRQGYHALVTWDTPASEGGHAAMARAYSSWGSPLCSSCDEFRLNAVASPNPTQPAAQVSTFGEVRAFWLGREDQGFPYDRILGQEYFWDGSPITSAPEIWGSALFDPVDISEFSVADSAMDEPMLAFTMAGVVYKATGPGSASPIYASGNQCAAPRLTNTVFVGQGLAMSCETDNQRLPFVALATNGGYVPNPIAGDVLPPYQPGTIALGGWGIDVDGNGLLSATLPAGIYGYDSSAAVFRVRGLASTAMSVAVSGQSPVASGADLNYTVTVSNDGPTSAVANHHELKGLALNLDLPAGTTLIQVDGADWSCSGSAPLQCKLAAVLPAQQQSTLTVRTSGLTAPASASLQASLSSIVNSNPSLATGSGSITIANPDQSPDPFSLPGFQSVPRTAYFVEQISISGIDAPTPISISNGRYAINAGAFTANSGTVDNGDTVQVEHYAAGTFSTTVSTTLTVGDQSASLTTTTEAEDSKVEPFDLADVSDVPRSSLQTSNAVSVVGINVPVAISIVGGSYAINGGAFVSTSGTVQVDDSVVVRHTAAAGFASSTNTTLTIGDQSAVFTSTTEAMDTTPTAFSFVDQSNLATNIDVTSAPITVTGINAPAAISLNAGSYSINGGPFVNAEGTVNANDQVRVRLRTAAAANTAVSASLTIGGVADTFTATTGATDTTPNAFTYTDQTNVRRNRQIISNTVTISGINAAVPITISGDASAKYSKNGAAFTASPGTVVNGDQVRLQVQSSASANVTQAITASIGGLSDVWSVTTGNR